MDYGNCRRRFVTLKRIKMDPANYKYEASINFDIKTYEIDIAGHVNNIVYVKWLEDLRNELFNKILPLDHLLSLHLYPVVISTNITYKKQLELKDKPVGYVSLENIRHNIMTLKFKFMKGGDICTFAEQKCVLMNLEKGTIDKEKFKSLTKLS